jgi:hypothetical protein
LTLGEGLQDVDRFPYKTSVKRGSLGPFQPLIGLYDGSDLVVELARDRLVEVALETGFAQARNERGGLGPGSIHAATLRRGRRPSYASS